MTDPSYKVWLAAEKKSKFTKGHCKCKAGLGESCSHIAALMFKLEAAVRLGFTTMACTSLPCSWNDLSTMKVKGAPIRDTIFYRPKVGKTKKRMKPVIPPSAESKHRLLAMLADSSQKSVALHTFSDFAQPFFTPEPPQGFPFPQQFHKFCRVAVVLMICWS